MAIRSTSTVGSQAAGATIPVDWKQTPFNLGIAVILAGGTPTYKVQYTLDNVFDPAVTPNWVDHATITGKSASFSDSLNIPCTAVRLNVTAWSAGTATMTVLQGQQGI